VIKKTILSAARAEAEFGMACQRLLPWTGEQEEPPFGVMACFLPAAATSAPDCHDQDEVMIVLSGTGTVRIGDESTDVSAGEVVAIGRNRTHVVHSTHQTALTWISFYWPLHEPVRADPALAQATPGEPA
jgi:mannose-6-phosphate isomerase-like protein (cupin superfamily)